MTASPARTVTLRVARAAFRSLERAAPGLAARWAERTWFRIPRPANRRPPRLPAGHDIEIEVYGRRVVGTSWGTGRPVYLVHGWGGSGAQFAAFVPALVDGGFRVLAYDAPSHGRSESGPSGPDSSNVVEFADTLRAMVQVYGEPAGVVAHSLGALAVALTIREGLVLERLVLVAPMADAASYTRSFAKALGGDARVAAQLATRIERRVGRPLSDFDIPATALVGPTPPVLVLHDKDDHETRLDGAREIVSAWPDSRLLVTEGLGHNRILRDPMVVAAAADFLARGAPNRESRDNSVHVGYGVVPVERSRA